MHSIKQRYHELKIQEHNMNFPRAQNLARRLTTIKIKNFCYLEKEEGGSKMGKSCEQDGSPAPGQVVVVGIQQPVT
jgi:hypothetical protein